MGNVKAPATSPCGPPSGGEMGACIRRSRAYPPLSLEYNHRQKSRVELLLPRPGQVLNMEAAFGRKQCFLKHLGSGFPKSGHGSIKGAFSGGCFVAEPLGTCASCAMPSGGSEPEANEPVPVRRAGDGEPFGYSFKKPAPRTTVVIPVTG
jgi:hypothetical protein